MSYTYDGTYLLATITFFATGVGLVFLSLDNVPFFDAPFSILDVIIAILLLRLMAWYVLRIISGKDAEWSDKATTEDERFEEYLSNKDVDSYKSDEDLNE